jgi:hypothetical protein
MIQTGLKLLLLSLSAVILFSCEEKVLKISDAIPYEEETYELINLNLSQSEYQEANLPDELFIEPFHENEHILSKIESAFPKEDLEFVRRQLKDTTAFSLKGNKLLLSEKVRLIPDDTIKKMLNEAIKAENFSAFWDGYRTTFGNRAMLLYAKPVFSKDGKTAAFYASASFGPLSGGGSIMLFTKKDKKWKPVRTLAWWIS